MKLRKEKPLCKILDLLSIGFLDRGKPVITKCLLFVTSLFQCFQKI